MKTRAGGAVLALDLAIATGWAARDQRGAVTSGVERFDLKRGESLGMRYLRFQTWLVTKALELGGDGRLVIAYETPLTVGKGFTAGFARELATIALMFGAGRPRTETTHVAPSALKKHATGNGRAEKPQMIAAAAARWGRAVTDDNEADALLVLAWALEQLGEEKR